MQTLSSLKKDLEFNRGLSSLIEALKNIAVSQYRSLEHKIKSFGVLLTTIESYFDAFDPAAVKHPYISAEDKPQAVVAVTSDSGLLGGLNIQVINAAISELEKHPGHLVVIGERGRNYVAEHKVPCTAFGGIRDEQRYAQAMQVRDYLASRALKGDFGTLRVIFPQPVSFTVQRVETVLFLPFVPPAHRKSAGAGTPRDMIFESTTGDIIEYLVYLWMGQKLFEIFGLSRLAEYAARYVHLEESLQKLKAMDNKQRLQYFRARHEIIDRNMRELFSARLLYAH